MQARRAARELALILFSQFDKNINSYSNKDFDEILLKSVRILTNNASEELKLSATTLVEMKEYIDTIEAEDESNLKRPIHSNNKPVPIPLTSDMSGRLDTLIDVVEKSLAALEIAEFATLETQSEVKDYVLKIAEAFKLHHEAVDAEIQKFAKGWDISRLVRMDKDILRIAISELLFIKETPLKVVVDEALELAKKYSTQDSSSFVNGILAKVIIENGID